MIAAARAGAISVVDVCKSYVREGRERPAVDHASLEIAPGTFCSLVGPSGCGKSTLLMMIAGLYTPTSGTIRVDDAPVSGPVPGVGMVFQKDVLLEWRTVIDNVLLPIEVKHLPLKAYREKALALLDLVNLRGYADSYPEQLSGGMRQRVAICRALIHDPALLLMDEPFGALDALTREKLNLDLIALTAQRGQTVVFVTHSIDEAVLMSDQIVVMTTSPGRVFRTLPVSFDGPRTMETRAEPRFLHYVTEIREAFHALGII
ncbi:MAG TPA: ABC transporter ATP-binding protein [Candidatus Limnocylindria bacterium]|nr:ABC transporter ATP-binding protein [Candidatus Limnocylindria bacterium]